MRSPAESRRLEGLLRGVALAALLAAVVVAFRQSRARGDAGRDVRVSLEAAPSPVQRDSLAALARSGRTVTWSGDVGAVVAVAEPLREPVAGWRVAVAGDGAIALRDSLDVLDSLDASGALTTEPTRGPVQAQQGATVALAAAPEAMPPQAVFVYGRVGWEPRFAMSALEEIGWHVDARLELGRDRMVRQGSGAPALGRHGVVIVFDSASLRREVGALQRFVRGGGGLVLAGSAASSRLLPTRRDSLLVALGDSAVTVRATRLGGGRVLALDEAETWRWRMQGEGAAVEAHREFWSRLVGVAAPARRAASDAPTPADALPMAASTAALASAPRAALVHAVGAETPRPRRVPQAPATLPWWLAPIILLALFTEWASRRRRGVP